MIGLIVLLVAPSVDAASFANVQGLHALRVVGGTIRHSLNDSPPAAVNGETGGGPSGVVAVAGSGFADLADVHVLAVDGRGVVWHTVRLGDGHWLPWGDVSAEIKYPGTAKDVRCATSGRCLAVMITDERGAETRTVRDADGAWSR